MFAAARDMTEHKALEEKLKNSERLAAIGATAGMVGHDMRNPLQAITSAIYLMKDDVVSLPETSEKKDLDELLKSVEDGVTYINKIVSDLQDYTRSIQPDLKDIDLQDLVEGTLEEIKIPDNIQVKVNIDEAQPRVNVDPELMQRVFTNLITNAVQAMPKGGNLTVKAEKNEDNIIISFTDTGVGIPEDVKPKLFTPLFTTKSRGQGFGLAVCKRIVEAHNGIIIFESRVGEGTTFTIRIPSVK